MAKLFETMRAEAYFAAGQLEGVVDQADADRILNSALREVYDLLVTANEDYNVTTSADLTVTSGDSVNLPANVYKVRGVDQKIGSDYFDIDRHSFGDRNRKSGAKSYTIVNSTLRVAPASEAPGTVLRVHYVPAFVDLVDGQSFDGINGWEELAIVEASIRMASAEESDVSVLMARKNALIGRIEKMAKRRDKGRPHKARDTRGSAWRGVRWSPDEDR